ncbi:MAG TPA: hypothetical protein VK936_03280 [Longimicrobiales bacterium]|nr:hypothetical protein [Longimicrobiales bacterium]
MRAGRRLLGLVVACAALGAVGAGTRVPWTPSSGEDAVLRLSWRLRGVRVEECRRLTPAELERQPAHMRREEVCEGRIEPYRLTVEIDGQRVEDVLVAASGARADRPLYVYREFRLRPGEHSAAVRFAVESGSVGDDDRVALTWSGRAVFRPGRVLLVTYDADARALVARDALE